MTRIFVALVFTGMAAPVSRAGAEPEGGTFTDVVDARSAATFAGGFLTALLTHEAGHLVANLSYGNTPSLEEIRVLGFVPFVAVSPEIRCPPGEPCVHEDGTPFSGGRRGKYLIVTAGFDLQHLGSEVVLSHDPSLRRHRAPFRKGFLAFNLATSALYAIASWTRIEPTHGDLANAARASGFQRDLFTLTVFVPAALDLYRYARPESCLAPWASWSSRASKTALVGFAFAF